MANKRLGAVSGGMIDLASQPAGEPERRVWILLNDGKLDTASSARLMTEVEAGATNSLILKGNPWKWHRGGNAIECLAAPEQADALEAALDWFFSKNNPGAKGLPPPWVKLAEAAIGED